MSAAKRVFRPSSTEAANHERLIAAADDARASGQPVTLIGDFVTSWPSRITKGELQGFEPAGMWTARGKGRQQRDGVWRTPCITISYNGAAAPARDSQFSGVIAALELLVDEFRALDRR